MGSSAFDMARYVRRLRESGVPELQATIHADALKEALGYPTGRLLTEDTCKILLDSQSMAQQRKHQEWFHKLESYAYHHSWALGLIVVVLVLPRLIEWFN